METNLEGCEFVLSKWHVQKIDANIHAIASQIIHIQQRAYRVEAELLGVPTIPPLLETVTEILTCEESFMGVWDAEQKVLLGFISWEETVVEDQSAIQICRLAVDPAYFGNGIACALLQEFFTKSCHRFTIVTTGADNIPAIRCYEKAGFQLDFEFLTPDRIRMVRLVHHRDE